MKKSIVIGLGMSLCLSFTAYAGEWKQDDNGWWWQNDDGTYPTNTWQWLDGNKDGISECYYFGNDGYLLVDTQIDGYIVDGNGAWVENGNIQTQQEQRNESQQTVDNGRLVDFSQWFYTDLQYFMKAREALDTDNYNDYWYCTNPDNSMSKYDEYYDIYPSVWNHGMNTSTDYYVYYDKEGDCPIVRIKGAPQAFITGLEDGKLYSVGEIESIIRETGAQNIQTENHDFLQGAPNLNGVGHTTWLSRWDHLTFEWNGLHYKYIVADGASDSYDMIVTKK